MTRAKPALASSARVAKLIHAPASIPHARADRYGSHRKSARPRAEAVARRSALGRAGGPEVPRRAAHTAHSAIDTTPIGGPMGRRSGRLGGRRRRLERRVAEHEPVRSRVDLDPTALAQ